MGLYTSTLYLHHFVLISTAPSCPLNPSHSSCFYVLFTIPSSQNPLPNPHSLSIQITSTYVYSPGRLLKYFSLSHYSFSESLLHLVGMRHLSACFKTVSARQLIYQLNCTLLQRYYIYIYIKYIDFPPSSTLHISHTP